MKVRTSLLPCMFLLCAGVLLTGCATPGEPPAFQPVHSERALIRWQRNHHMLTADAVLARSRDDGVLLRLYKRAPAPLLELRLESGGQLTASGALAGRGWRGPRAEAPAPLAAWVSFLTVYQHAGDLPVGKKELHSPGLRVAYGKTKDGLKSLSIANTDAAETVSAIFNQP